MLSETINNQCCGTLLDTPKCQIVKKIERLEQLTTPRQPSTAPKDGRMFLGLFKGFTNNYFACSWSGVESEFALAIPQVDRYKGKLEDFYFENGFVKESDLINWLPMPRGGE